jgi:hypothetical protein
VEITVEDLKRLGVEKLCNFLGLETIDEFKLWLVSTFERPSLAEIAFYLSAEASVCSNCGDNYVTLVESSVCDVCLDNAWSSRSWS